MTPEITLTFTVATTPDSELCVALRREHVTVYTTSHFETDASVKINRDDWPAFMSMIESVDELVRSNEENTR